MKHALIAAKLLLRHVVWYARYTLFKMRAVFYDCAFEWTDQRELNMARNPFQPGMLRDEAHDSNITSFLFDVTVFGICTLKPSYKRPPHILSSSSESKIRSIKIHDHMNKPMSNSGSVSFCIPKCVILLTQTKHV